MRRAEAITDAVVDAWRDLSHEQRNVILDRYPRLTSALIALEAVSRIHLVID